MSEIVKPILAVITLRNFIILYSSYTTSLAIIIIFIIMLISFIFLIMTVYSWISIIL